VAGYVQVARAQGGRVPSVSDLGDLIRIASRMREPWPCGPSGHHGTTAKGYEMCSISALTCTSFHQPIFDCLSSSTEAITQALLSTIT
jgi:hypothetical protein